MAQPTTDAHTARDAVVRAIIDSVAGDVAIAADDVNIHQFWLTLYDQGYEVVPRPGVAR